MKTELEQTYKHQQSVSFCGLFDVLDFCRMADGAMNDTEMERFVQHCEQCNDCSKALWAYQKEMIAAHEEQLSGPVVLGDGEEYNVTSIQERDDRLIRRSLDFLDKLRNS